MAEIGLKHMDSMSVRSYCGLVHGDSGDISRIFMRTIFAKKTHIVRESCRSIRSSAPSIE